MCQLFILKPGSLHHRTPHLSLQVLLPQQHAAICEDPWHQAIQRFQNISKPVNSEANLGSLIVGPQGYKNTDGSGLGYKEPPFWLICESKYHPIRMGNIITVFWQVTLSCLCNSTYSPTSVVFTIQ
jgi:hypothetical protein